MESTIPESLLPGTNMSRGHGLDYFLVKDASQFENEMKMLMRNIPPSQRVNKYYPIPLSFQAKYTNYRHTHSKLVPEVSKVVINLQSCDRPQSYQARNKKSCEKKQLQFENNIKLQKVARKHLTTSVRRRRWTRAEDELLVKAMSKNKPMQNQNSKVGWIAIEKEMQRLGQSDRKIVEIKNRARHLNLDPRFYR